MLLVPTYLDKSPIHGVGCFAAKPVRKGDSVWFYSPKVDLTLADGELPYCNLFRDYYRRYAYRDLRTGKLVLCADNARFINHADDPNLQPNVVEGKYLYDSATRDIAAGEELTIDYRLIDADCAKAEGALF